MDSDVGSDRSYERLTDIDYSDSEESGSDSKSDLYMEGQSDAPHPTSTLDRQSEKNRNNHNPAGKNQHTPAPPLDDNLANLLRELNRNNITGYNAIMEKTAERGYPLKRTKLAQYLKILNLGTSRRKTIPSDEADQLVLDEMADDPMETQGPRAIKEALDLKGKHLPRPQVEAIMKAFAPGGFDKRKPTSRKLKRSALVSVGANAEWSLDEHDKLLSAGFAIYGIRDKWSGYWLFYVVVPSNRFAAAIGVIYLQCVRKYGGIPVQTTSDRGSEVRDAYAFQLALRENFEPGYIAELIPAWVFVSSPRNITIERGWRPLFETWGRNILFFFNEGRFGGFFEPNNDLHQQTSNWIWFPLVQCELDKWVEKQNSHRIRKQTKKYLPSGGRPDNFYANPERYGGESCLIPIPKETINDLLEQCHEGYEKLRYIDREFEEIVEDVYKLIGSPKITLHTAWQVFCAMVEQMGEGGNSS